jgi:N-acetylglucosaminyl-diphospho-decaprenol L-rhamnosyltransferase
MVSPHSAARAPAVAVVTVGYASNAVLPAFLDSVHHASVTPPLIVVADNKAGDQDNARDLAAAQKVQYLPLADNLGYGGAVNAAVATLPGDIEWILVSNPDVVLGAGSLDILVALAIADDRIGSVGPLIRTSTGDVYPSARTVPSLRTGIGHALFANLWQANPWTRAYRRETETSLERKAAGWLSGACLLVRRAAFEQLGGFDKGFFMYFEDVDLGYRLGKAGYLNMYEPAATVVHSGGHSTTTDSARMIRAHHESARRFLGKKYAGFLLWPVRAVLRVGLAIRSGFAVRRLER